MTLTPSLPTGSPAGLPLLAERRIWAGAVARAADGTPRTGVLPAHFDPLVTGKASMGYRIAEFVAVTSRSLPGVELVANDGSVDLSPAGYAAPAANSRLDVIWVRSRFPELGDAFDSPEFGITKGAASPTPVKPSLPAGALELAVAEVKATDTTTQTVVITQTARYTAIGSDPVALRNVSEQNAWTPSNGARAHRLDTRVGLLRAGGAWVRSGGEAGQFIHSDGGSIIQAGGAVAAGKIQPAELLPIGTTVRVFVSCSVWLPGQTGGPRTAPYAGNLRVMQGATIRGTRRWHGHGAAGIMLHPSALFQWVVNDELTTVPEFDVAVTNDQPSTGGVELWDVSVSWSVDRP